MDDLDVVWVLAGSSRASAHEAVKGDSHIVLHVVDLADSSRASNHVGHRNGEILHVAKAREVATVAGYADGPVRLNALEEVLLQRVVVLCAVDVRGADARPRQAAPREELLRVQLTLVPALEVHLVTLHMRHLLALLVHACGAHVDEVLQVRRAHLQRLNEGLRVGRLAPVHVIAHVERSGAQEGSELLRVLAVPDNEVRLRYAPFKVGLRFAWDGDRIGLAAIVQRHRVAAIDEFLPQVVPAEARATDDENLLRLKAATGAQDAEQQQCYQRVAPHLVSSEITPARTAS